MTEDNETSEGGKEAKSNLMCHNKFPLTCRHLLIQNSHCVGSNDCNVKHNSTKYTHNKITNPSLQKYTSQSAISN